MPENLNPSAIPSDVETTTMTADQLAVWAAMNSVYEGFLAGRSDDVDRLMAPEVTIWDSEEPELARGLAQLQQIRARRPTDPSAPTVVSIEATDPVIDVYGHVAVVRHLLRVAFADDQAAPQLVRNSSVWRLMDGRWLAVHNHEDVIER